MNTNNTNTVNESMITKYNLAVRHIVEKRSTLSAVSQKTLNQDITQKQQVLNRLEHLKDVLEYLILNFFDYNEVIRIDATILSEIAGINLGKIRIHKVSLRTLKYIADNPTDRSLMVDRIYLYFSDVISRRLSLETDLVYLQINKICTEINQETHF